MEKVGNTENFSFLTELMNVDLPASTSSSPVPLLLTDQAGSSTFTAVDVLPPSILKETTNFNEFENQT
ncbi:hypothetical protein PPYR_01568, partial [Photinus pyralis]